MIRIEGLTKYYGSARSNGGPAIDSVSFDVKDGEIVGFVGLNGAGKTTTIRIATGVTLPSSGSVSVDGHDIVREKPEASMNIGWVPEFPNYEQNSKAKDLMMYFAGFRGMPKSETETRIAELFQRVGLQGHEKRKLRNYSQGMKKRFSLALALLSSPRNYMFDEILNGLDPQGIHYMRLLMVDLKNRGNAVVLSSHILSEIETISDRVVFIHKGKIIKIVTKAELSAIETGGATLRIVIQNLNPDALAYLKTRGQVSTGDASTVWLANFSGDPAEISTELIRRGFMIREFSLQKSSLEDYFFKLVGAPPGDAVSTLPPAGVGQ
jgi:ABC-2 type transport system ATP-binding protein